MKNIIFTGLWWVSWCVVEEVELIVIVYFFWSQLDGGCVILTSFYIQIVWFEWPLRESFVPSSCMLICIFIHSLVLIAYRRSGLFLGFPDSNRGTTFTLSPYPLTHVSHVRMFTEYNPHTPYFNDKKQYSSVRIGCTGDMWCVLVCRLWEYSSVGIFKYVLQNIQVLGVC